MESGDRLFRAEGGPGVLMSLGPAARCEASSPGLSGSHCHLSQSTRALGHGLEWGHGPFLLLPWDLEAACPQPMVTSGPLSEKCLVCRTSRPVPLVSTHLGVMYGHCTGVIAAPIVSLWGRHLC